MRKTIFISVLFALLVRGYPLPYAIADSSAEPLEGLIKELLTHNPEVLSLMEEVNAARYRVSIEKSLDDPRFSAEAMDIATRNPMLSQTPMDGVQLYLMQAVPFPGKRKLKKDLALLRVEETHQSALEKINDMVSQFKQTCFDHAYITEAIAISDRTLNQLSGTKSVLESRYTTNGGSAMQSGMSTAKVTQSDILKTNLEISTIDRELIMLRNSQKRNEAKLTALLNRPVGAPIHIKPIAKTSLLPELAQILEMAQLHRPSIQKAKVQVKEGELEHRLAKKSFLPDFDFSAGYRVRSFNGMDPAISENFVSAGIELNVPLWAGYKQKKMVAEAASMKKSREYMQTATTRSVLSDIEIMYYDLQEMKSQIALYRSRLLPESEANLASSRRNYEIGVIDYRDVIMGQTLLLENQLMLAALRYGYEKKMAELEMQVGAPLATLNPQGELK